ncbi:YceI family protein [Flagellimonas marina]|uniref:YceI family protein n=1 Tax=Flagellimonas marina TaxID=1775168 RepID=A0ABV8PI63_9FLAO
MKTNQILKVCFVFVALCSTIHVTGQKLVDRNGHVAFQASEALFEPVEAKNESVTAVLDVATHEIASLALIKGFRFKNSLMEEHFNENYIESEKYPKATFKGQLMDFDIANVTDAPQQVRVDGKLELHGKEKAIETYLNVGRAGDAIVISGSFSVTPDDFDISIPSIVKNKIAKEVIVSLEFKMKEL